MRSLRDLLSVSFGAVSLLCCDQGGDLLANGTLWHKGGGNYRMSLRPHHAYMRRHQSNSRIIS